jgi:hypothetical protein
LSCTTVNGEKHCAQGSHTTSCKTVDGHTECHGDADQKPNARDSQPQLPLPQDHEDNSDAEDRDDSNRPDPILKPHAYNSDVNATIDSIIKRIIITQWASSILRPTLHGIVINALPRHGQRLALAEIMQESRELLVRNGKTVVHIRKPCPNCNVVHRP